MINDPQTIGNYEVLNRLGRGGMATVYRARQTTMQRDVAIKIMSDALVDDPQFVARFEREARMIAQLEHPRILPVHDFGHEGEMFYLVMRLIEGESLYHRLLRGPLDVRTSAKFLNQIAEALDYAHSRGIIHRDLKPNNVMIDEYENLYLMDFGLAKMGAASHNLTQSGTVLGTPAYMSPEQVRGEAVDARADVYALGIILYEMLTGHPPFEADTPFTLMYKHVNDTPPDITEAFPALPSAVRGIIEKALAKLPAERYASAGELAREFGAVARVAGSLQIRDQQVSAPEPEDVDTPSQPDAHATVPEVRADAGASPDVTAALVPPLPPDDIVPPPVDIIPPIPLGGSKRQPTMPSSDYGFGTPDPSPSRVSHAEGWRQALETIDQSVEAALERAAESLSKSDKFKISDRAAIPLSAPAFDEARRALHPAEDLVGMLDVRGTTYWRRWKRMLVGGLAGMIVGGVLSSGFVSFLGFVALFYLAVDVARTWRGRKGRYWLIFTPERVVLLPRDKHNRAQYNRVVASQWGDVGRLRLTNRYALLDVFDPYGAVTQFGAVILPDGDGGLGKQPAWLPTSPIPDLIADHGFEVELD